jgi:hypothetical protein
MRIHEKARAYDELMKDIEEFLKEVEEHADSVDKIGDSEEGRENNPSFYAMKTGLLTGSNFGLRMKISRFKGNLNFYKSLK